MNKSFKKHELHIIFLFLLSLNYIIPFFIFGNITLFYHDTLDSEIVFNTIIGRSFNDNFDSLKLFLNEQIPIEYLRRAYQPFTTLYHFLNPELSYWLIDIMVKLTAYFSFFCLAKKINKNFFICALGAALFASINERTVEGFGFAYMPYLIYLISFKTNIKLKHFIITLLFGLNTDLVTCFTTVSVLFFVLYILNTKDQKNFIKDLILLLSVFILSILISNFNLIYGQIKYGEIQRLDFFYESQPFLINILSYFIELIKFPSFGWTLLKQTPQLVIFSTVILLTLLHKERKSLNLFYLILLVNFVPFLFRTEFISNIRNFNNGFFKTFHFEYITSIIPLVFSIMLILVLNKNFFTNYITKLLLLLLIVFQINSSIVPVIKKFITNKSDYRNIYTFNGYYMYDDYKKIKDIVKNKKTLSIGYDPMIAVMNNIYAVDGYHNVYPLHYKKKFRKVIEKELDKDINLKKYYDYWGNRVYAFINDEQNIDLNFFEAKSLGAEYLISKYVIDSANIVLVDNNFNNAINLYKIK